MDDIENLRRHYALTLDAWAERFDRRWDEIHASTRSALTSACCTWRTHFWSCAELFQRQPAADRPVPGDGQQGNLGADYPMSRAFLYR